MHLIMHEGLTSYEVHSARVPRVMLTDRYAWSFRLTRYLVSLGIPAHMHAHALPRMLVSASQRRQKGTVVGLVDRR